MVRLNVIVARSRNGTIGRDGGLPWHLPADLKRFREITMGSTLVMGRRTYESIGRPLPGRRNLVVSGTPGFAPPGCEVFRSLEQACAAVNTPELFVIGGAGLYREALSRAQRIFLTEVHADIGGDVVFPDLPADAWHETSREEHVADDRHAYPYAFVTLERSAGAPQG
jgi:dihydrofolate reductase